MINLHEQPVPASRYISLARQYGVLLGIWSILVLIPFLRDEFVQMPGLPLFIEFRLHRLFISWISGACALLLIVPLINGFPLQTTRWGIILLLHLVVGVLFSWIGDMLLSYTVPTVMPDASTTLPDAPFIVEDSTHFSEPVANGTGLFVTNNSPYDRNNSVN